MEDVFDKLGMKTIPTVGEPFNYEVHQAVMSRCDGWVVIENSVTLIIKENFEIFTINKEKLKFLHFTPFHCFCVYDLDT